MTLDDATQDPSDTLAHSPGCQVKLQRPPTYLRTADERPMLRPPDLVDPEEWGTVTAVRPGDLRAVRFRRGTFLVPAELLMAAADAAVSGEGDGPAPATAPDHRH